MRLRILYLILGLLVVVKIGHFGKSKESESKEVTKKVRSTSNASFEHAVRKLLLTDYDSAVLPRLGGGHVDVLFGLKLNKLVKVDNKEQLLTVDTWIIMKWNNTFLQWDKAKYGGLNVLQFKPKEIWFPDIQLYNNGDQMSPRAGGREKFLSDVKVRSTGECTWSGPAQFTVNCEMELNTYPFDKQSCEMRFGSFNYARNKIRINQFKTKKNKGDRYVDSGDWDLSDFKITTGETDHGHCCPYKFSELSVGLVLTRKFKYHLFYLVAPCALLSVLSLVSFFIPTESGERIGFVTTLLLGMMVFLLIIPESLPESSKSIPILGVLMMATMIMIALILLVTIFILKCFHSKRKPPGFLGRNLARTQSHKPISKSGPHSTPLGVDNISLRAVGPDSRPPSVNAFMKAKEMDNEATWQAFARLCDKIMFVVFLIFTIIMYAVTLTYRS